MKIFDDFLIIDHPFHARRIGVVFGPFQRVAALGIPAQSGGHH